MALSLRDRGVQAFALKGGFDAWRATGILLEPRSGAGASQPAAP